LANYTKEKIFRETAHYYLNKSKGAQEIINEVK